MSPAAPARRAYPGGRKAWMPSAARAAGRRAWRGPLSPTGRAGWHPRRRRGHSRSPPACGPGPPPQPRTPPTTSPRGGRVRRPPGGPYININK
eukprot:7472623-Pyramimonas_sp.AAC.2